MKYFLVGYMACGKSRRGRLMAESLGIRFIDLDDYIVRREMRTIPQIFAVDGEDVFRRLEQRYLHEVCELYGDFVMATGGGTPCFFDNMEYMNRQGKTIFLNTDVDIIVGRLLKAKFRRPLISRLNNDEVHAYVEKHLQERMPFYLQAQKIENSYLS